MGTGLHGIIWSACVQADTANKLSSALVETFAKSPFGQTAEKGAIALEYACTSPDMDGAAAPPSAGATLPCPS